MGGDHQVFRYVGGQTFNWHFKMRKLSSDVSSTTVGLDGLTVSTFISTEEDSFAATTNSPSQGSMADGADGWYSLILTTTETTDAAGQPINLLATGSTAIPAEAVLYPDTTVIATGTGSRTVDEDFAGTVDGGAGGVDSLRIIDSNGNGVDNVDIKAYLQTDWNAGNKTEAFVKATARTKVDGRWTAAMSLDVGTYVLLAERQNLFTKQITIVVT